ncbi:MAG: AraC family transcriptional regulator [Pseudomonadota bacterium]|jgi:AraC family transcriptional regulator|nr:AraC family transcriptional regulator [Pseudomonadota bacterium]
MNKATPMRALEAFSRGIGIGPVRSSDGQACGGLAVCEWELPWLDGFQLSKNDDLVIAYHSAGSRKVRAACEGPWIDRNSTPGLISVIPPGRSVDYRIDGKVSFSSIHIPRRAVAGLAGLRTPGSEQFQFAFRDSFASACIETLLSEDRNAGARNVPYLTAVTRALLVHLVHRAETDRSLTASKTPSPGQARGMPLAPILEFIDGHLDQELSLGELAHQAGLSRAHFARQFHAATGVSPHRYVTLRRIERAKHLLSSTDRDVAQITYEVGFNSQSHFTQVFHTATGQTPCQFRRVN